MNSATLKPWLLPILSGILIGTSYIPFPPWASLFCFVPLWLFWHQQTSLKHVLLGGILTSFIFTLIGFNWVTYLLHEFAHLDWPVAAIGMLVLWPDSPHFCAASWRVMVFGATKI